MDKRLNYIKPMILAHAGIVASSVAILIALIVGTAGKDNDLYRSVFASAMGPMALVVVLSTITVVLLQALYFGWQLAPRYYDGKKPPAWGKYGAPVVVIIVFFALSVMTVAPGFDSAKHLFTGSKNIVEKKNPDLFLCPAERAALPWILRRFYRGGPTGPCSQQKAP
jgi:hypothetical protein